MRPQALPIRMLRKRSFQGANRSLVSAEYQLEIESVFDDSHPLLIERQGSAPDARILDKVAHRGPSPESQRSVELAQRLDRNTRGQSGSIGVEERHRQDGASSPSADLKRLVPCGHVERAQDPIFRAGSTGPAMTVADPGLRSERLGASDRRSAKSGSQVTAVDVDHLIQSKPRRHGPELECQRWDNPRRVVLGF